MNNATNNLNSEPRPASTTTSNAAYTTYAASTYNYNIVKEIPASIFRAYDIRGVVGETFTPNNIYTIGIAIGCEALARGEHTIAVGRDGRLSGPELSRALQQGIAVSGCNVIDIGMVTTPMLYYAANTLNTRSGVMLTGSHNPPEYNGIKIVLNGEALYEATITKLYQRIIDSDLPCATTAAAVHAGTIEQRSITDSYVQRIVSDIKLMPTQQPLKRPLKVVIDCGNGVGGLVAPHIFRELGCTVFELFCDVDGNFPNHHPDPAVEKNLQDLIAAVKQHEADIGFAFDGDADRVGVITNKGEIIAADRLLMLFALDILTRHPNAIIPFDVKCTRHISTQVALHGGKPLMVQTGHSLVKAKMKQVGALIAGELSGHIFFKERWYGFDDGVYSAVRYAELLAQNTRTCSEMFAALPNSVNTPELKLPVAEEKKSALMHDIVAKMQFGDDATITTIDGVRADFKDGFGLIRQSNTTPYLIMRFEGDTQEALQRITELFRTQLLKVDANLRLPF